MAETVGISSATCRWILTKDLNMHRVGQHIVPRSSHAKRRPICGCNLHRRLKERTWLKMDSRNVSMAFTSHGKSVLLLKGLISKVLCFSSLIEFTTELESCCDIILTHLCDLTLFKSTVLNSGSESDLELNEKSPPENHHSQPITSDSANLLELVKPFTSRDSYSIETFISDIEDMFRLYQITNPIHQIIFVKKCLKGPAENLIRSIRGITNWSQMKEHLLNEFSDRINSAQLHKMMQARRLKPTETLQEYFLTMRDLAHKGIGRDRVESKGYFKNFITIQNTALPAKIHVVNDETIPLDAILGIDFLQQTKFTFGRDGIRIFRDVDECKNDDVLHKNFKFPDSRNCSGCNYKTASHASYPHVKLVNKKAFSIRFQKVHLFPSAEDGVVIRMPVWDISYSQTTRSHDRTGSDS
ncbi:retrovirus-related Pol polyprotein from transposon gypsy, partial [Trichonephila clavipes]